MGVVVGVEDAESVVVVIVVISESAFVGRVALETAICIDLQFGRQ